MKATWMEGTLLLAVMLGFFGLFFLDGREAWSADRENHCFTCHTNARKLIEITRNIQKNLKEKPGASEETQGEG
ncbi:MAG: hypothetical protein P8Y38_08390 [Deltaproteobacteria bacterium]|jgi:hypothetical protein